MEPVPMNKAWYDYDIALGMKYKQRKIGKHYVIEMFYRPDGGAVVIPWNDDDWLVNHHKEWEAKSPKSEPRFSEVSDDGKFYKMDEIHFMYAGNAEEYWGYRFKTVKGLFEVMREKG